MKKLLICIPLALAVTFGLFAFMAALVTQEQPEMPTVEDYPVVEVMELKEDSKPTIRTRVELKPPPMQEPPEMDLLAQAETSTQDGFSFSPPELAVTNLTGGGPKFSAPTDGDARPVIRVDPRYPATAAQKGIEGWVKLSFDIDTIGKVVNIQVLDAQPKRMFNKAARQALRKWKYRARVVDGKPVVQQGLTVQLDFNLNKSS